MKNFIYLFTLVLALGFASCSDDDDLATISITESVIETFDATITYEDVENAYYYDLDLSTDGGDFEYIESSYSGYADNTFEIDDLLAGTSYKARVTAYSSSNSEIAEGTYSFTTVEAVSELVGTWNYSSDYSDYSYTFNADGTGEYSSGSNEYLIKWEASPLTDETTVIKISLYTNDYDGAYSYNTLTYSYDSENDVLEISDNSYTRAEE